MFCFLLEKEEQHLADKMVKIYDTDKVLLFDFTEDEQFYCFQHIFDDYYTKHFCFQLITDSQGNKYLKGFRFSFSEGFEYLIESFHQISVHLESGFKYQILLKGHKV